MPFPSKLLADIKSIRRDRPALGEPGLTIWTCPDLPGTAADLLVKLEDDLGSEFFRGASRRTPLYLKVYSQLYRGPKLAPGQVGLLLRGGSLTASFASSTPGLPAYRAHVAVGDIQQVPWKSQPDKRDNILRFRRARWLSTETDPTLPIAGWVVDQTIFPPRLAAGEHRLELALAQIFQCVKRGRCQVQAHEVTYLGAETIGDHRLKYAKLQVSPLRHSLRGEIIPSSSAS